MWKVAWTFGKPVLQVVGLLFGAYVAVDLWVVSKVQTTTEPIKTTISEHIKTEEIKHASIATSIERFERESIMIRDNQERTNALLLQIARGQK